MCDAAKRTAVGILRALIAHRAKGAVIGMIVDPEAAEAATAAGEGALLDCGVGAKVGYAGENPVEAQWRVVRLGNGRVGDSGEVLEIDRPRRLVLSWRNEFRPELKVEGYSRATFEIEPVGQSVKLTVIHEMERDGSKFIAAVSNGWPHILASLKSLLETGQALAETARWPAQDRCVTPR